MPEPIFSPLRGIPMVLQNAIAAAGGGPVIAIPNSYLHHKIYIIGSAGVASGAIQVETSDDPLYAGLWAPVGAPVTVIVGELVVDLPIGPYLFLRTRISTIIGGGTVTTKYLGAFG